MLEAAALIFALALLIIAITAMIYVIEYRGPAEKERMKYERKRLERWHGYEYLADDTEPHEW